MKSHFQKPAICLCAAFLIASTLKSGAFALLGPFQPWMQATNGVIVPGDIGGPMCISNGYRWNVPVVTYGFDQSFLDFFGSNGVAAVESAIGVLNALPPASSRAFTNYPDSTIRDNYTAASQSLYDLKSVTLSLLLEQMGLANPNRFLYVLTQWNLGLATSPEVTLLPSGITGTYIVQLNFDPLTFSPSNYLNGEAFGYEIELQDNQYYIGTYLDDPMSYFSPAVASFDYFSGAYYTGLTYDDVGGLAYLLSTNNVNFETLLPGVIGAGTNTASFVNGAWRPGVDKITFIPQLVDSNSGQFLQTTNCFTDNYLTNGVLHQQQLARTISKPDFLFSAGDVPSSVPTIPLYTRTGATNWLDNAAANGNTNGACPGVIRPQVNIVFNKLGPVFYTYSDQLIDDPFAYYGSFDGTTNSPVIYPALQAATNQLSVRMWIVMDTPSSSYANSFEWKLTSATGAQFTLQTSTDLTGWTDVFSVTNNGSVFTYLNYNPTGPSRFYRLVPQ